MTEIERLTKEVEGLREEVRRLAERQPTPFYYPQTLPSPLGNHDRWWEVTPRMIADQHPYQPNMSFAHYVPVKHVGTI